VKRGLILPSVLTAALIAGVAGGVTLSEAAAATTGAAAAAATAGCGRAPSLASGTHTIQSGGQNRTYILRTPDGYDNTRGYRLIFAFHWNGGTATEVDSGGTSGFPWSYYGQRALANNSAIFVAPQGIGNGWANSGGRDLTFVDDMTKQIESALCVDTTQRFAMGFSYGGGMSYALACSRANVFRAVAVYSGANLSGCTGGTQPIAYLGIHGLRDNVLPIAQGRALRDQFVRNNGCTAQNPPEPAQGSLTHKVTYYAGCRAGYPVVWAPFDGPHAPNAVDGSADPFAPGERSWTRQVVWDFFTELGTAPSGAAVPPASVARSGNLLGKGQDS
jgi:poly(3-hydroxybutyrate) depolymerase